MRIGGDSSHSLRRGKRGTGKIVKVEVGIEIVKVCPSKRPTRNLENVVGFSSCNLGMVRVDVEDGKAGSQPCHGFPVQRNRRHVSAIHDAIHTLLPPPLPTPSTPPRTTP